MSAPASYNPPRQAAPAPPANPLEIDLVYNVSRCGTCSFFWPSDPNRQTYGPYPGFDFATNTPATADGSGNPSTYPWLEGVTGSPCFPNAEVMDGCRKAPIMTIGINPNLTAFAPGRMGAAWAYPSFSSAAGTDLFAKTAYYYRYRSVYQERFDLGFMEKYLVKAGQVVAPKSGVVVDAQRPSDSPTYSVKVRYDGDTADTVLTLAEAAGQPRYVLLFDPEAPNNRFAKGAVIAAKLDVPAGDKVEVYQQQISYYEQFVPVLQGFETFLAAHGHAGANLRVGEDVGQLDMVACASPHWGPPFLGNSSAAVNTVISNCVSKNAWAIKQLVQTRPAVLFLVGEASYDMFKASFGALIKPPLPETPADGAFTLLSQTVDPKQPRNIVFSTVIGGTSYTLTTRLVISPHFSYYENFLPQFRLDPAGWLAFEKKFPACVTFLRGDSRISYSGAEEGGFAAYTINRDPAGVLAALKATYADALAVLNTGFYDAHQMMAGVLAGLYTDGTLAYTEPSGGKPGYLSRSQGSCSFCVNDRWTFPLGCPYGKTTEAAPPNGFLESVASAMVKAGHP
jgi:hypothetical protein